MNISDNNTKTDKYVFDAYPPTLQNILYLQGLFIEMPVNIGLGEVAINIVIQ
jgi:hypothetical protein